MARQTVRRKLHRQFKDIVNWLDSKGTMSAYSSSILGGNSLGIDRRISTDTFFSIYRSSGDVYAVVRELSENVGSEGYVWKNKTNAEKDPNVSELKRSEQILNNNRTFRRWKSQLIQSVSITGNAYVHIETGQGTNKPLGLNFIDPRTMSVVTDKYGNIIKWVQRVRGQAVDFNPEEIAHFYIQKDPNSPVFGLSPLEPIFYEVRTDQQAMISNYVFFENDAVPAAHYIIDEDLSDEEQVRAVEAIREQVQGASNRHKSIAVKGLKDIKTLSISQKDMEFNVMRRFTTEKVCSSFGVPKSVLNYTEDVNLATAEAQDKKFWEGTIRPMEESLAEFINVNLLPKMGIKNIHIEFKPRAFENREWNEASTRADLMAGVLTINEVRESRGLEPFETSTEGSFVEKPMIYQGMGVTPLEDVGVDLEDLPQVETEDQAEKEIEKIKKISERYLYGSKTD